MSGEFVCGHPRSVENTRYFASKGAIGSVRSRCRACHNMAATESERAKVRARADGVKRLWDFTLEERSVIAERRKVQSAHELAAVFGTTPRVIGCISRLHRRASVSA